MVGSARLSCFVILLEAVMQTQDLQDRLEGTRRSDVLLARDNKN
jgi:hypothetical protein